MIEWLRVRLRERTTWAGIVAIGLAVALLIVPIKFEGEVAAQLSANIQWLITALFIGGLGGVVWHRKV